MARRGDDYSDPYATAYAGDDPRVRPSQPTAPSSPASSGTGVRPPWWTGQDPPFAPGKGWADIGPQQSPDGSTWGFNPQTGAWEKQAATTPPPGGPPPPSPGGPGPNVTDPGPFNAPATPFPGASGTGVPATPVFTPPGYTKPPAFSYADFQGPTAESVLNDPGYTFSRDQGQQGLAQSKAAGGVLKTGGTLKDILAWGQNYASTRFNDVYNRNLNTYNTNRQGAVQAYDENYHTQYLDPYQIAYRGAADAFAPTMTAFGTNAQANQRGNELAYNNAWDQFLQRYRQGQDLFHNQASVLSS